MSSSGLKCGRSASPLKTKASIPLRGQHLQGAEHRGVRRPGAEAAGDQEHADRTLGAASNLPCFSVHRTTCVRRTARCDKSWCGQAAAHPVTCTAVRAWSRLGSPSKPVSPFIPLAAS